MPTGPKRGWSAPDADAGPGRGRAPPLLDRGRCRGDVGRERAQLGVHAGELRPRAAGAPAHDADLDPGVLAVALDHRAARVALAGVDAALVVVARAEHRGRVEVALVRRPAPLVVDE